MVVCVLVAVVAGAQRDADRDRDRERDRDEERDGDRDRDRDDNKERLRNGEFDKLTVNRLIVKDYLVVKDADGKDRAEISFEKDKLGGLMCFAPGRVRQIFMGITPRGTPVLLIFSPNGAELVNHLCPPGIPPL